MLLFSTPILFSLSLALVPTFSTSLQNPRSPLPVLCYDSRYALFHPDLQDCATIINRQIGQASKLDMLRSFSRHPNRYQLPLPHTWATERHECNVTIDLLKLPGERVPDVAQASLSDIKRAAFEVFLACVLRDHHLGGITQTGRLKNLQVRVEGGGVKMIM